MLCDRIGTRCPLPSLRFTLYCKPIQTVLAGRTLPLVPRDDSLFHLCRGLTTSCPLKEDLRVRRPDQYVTIVTGDRHHGNGGAARDHGPNLIWDPGPSLFSPLVSNPNKYKLRDFPSARGGVIVKYARTICIHGQLPRTIHRSDVYFVTSFK